MNRPIFYKDIGSGPAIFLVHGLALDHSIWLPVADILSTGFRVILPDVQSHGKSTLKSEQTSMELLGEDLVKLMDELKIEKAFIGGHSMGGYITMSILKYFPSRLSGIALTASHIYADSDEVRIQRLEMAARLKNENVEEVFASMPGKLTKHPSIAKYCEKLISQTNADGLPAILSAMASRPSYESVWQKSTVPSIIIAGVEDQFIPMELTRKMQKLAPDSQLFEIEDAGHLPMLEEPQHIADILSKFAD